MSLTKQVAFSMRLIHSTDANAKFVFDVCHFFFVFFSLSFLCSVGVNGPLHISNPLGFLYFYLPPTKLREGNIFSRICHSVQGGRVIPAQGPSPTASMCRALVLIPHSEQDAAHKTFIFVHCDALNVGKRAVGIQLKCFLVAHAVAHVCVNRCQGSKS